LAFARAEAPRTSPIATIRSFVGKVSRLRFMNLWLALDGVPGQRSGALTNP
jgi:hypothetical protein